MTEPVPLTAKVVELTAAERLGRPAVGALTADEIAQLALIARRQAHFALPVDAHRALSALAIGAHPDVAVPVLDSVLSNASAPRTDRVTAALGLGQVASAGAEEALLRHLHERDPRVAQDVFTALGLFAGPDALSGLAALDLPADPAARTQLQFARALIAHRQGLDGPFLPAVNPTERRPGRPEQMTSIDLAWRPAEQTAADLGRLRGFTYGIHPAAGALTLHCGPTESVILLNDAMGHAASDQLPALPPGLAGIFERPWIAAVLAQWLPGRESLVARLVALTRPVGGRVRIDLVRVDGQVVYTGTLERTGDAVSLNISDVDRPGTAPTTLRGRLTADRVDLTTVVAFASRTGARTAAPVAVR